MWNRKCLLILCRDSVSKQYLNIRYIECWTFKQFLLLDITNIKNVEDRLKYDKFITLKMNKYMACIILPAKCKCINTTLIII